MWNCVEHNVMEESYLFLCLETKLMVHEWGGMGYSLLGLHALLQFLYVLLWNWKSLGSSQAANTTALLCLLRAGFHRRHRLGGTKERKPFHVEGRSLPQRLLHVCSGQHCEPSPGSKGVWGNLCWHLVPHLEMLRVSYDSLHCGHSLPEQNINIPCRQAIFPATDFLKTEWI